MRSKKPTAPPRKPVLSRAGQRICAEIGRLWLKRQGNRAVQRRLNVLFDRLGWQDLLRFRNYADLLGNWKLRQWESRAPRVPKLSRVGELALTELVKLWPDRRDRQVRRRIDFLRESLLHRDRVRVVNYLERLEKWRRDGASA